MRTQVLLKDSQKLVEKIGQSLSIEDIQNLAVASSKLNLTMNRIAILVDEVVELFKTLPPALPPG
jgi:hypothetical protein